MSTKEVADIIRAHIKVDATGLAPAVIGHYIFGFEEAAAAVEKHLAAPAMLEALKECAKTFRRYEELHAAKATVDGAQKAAANAYRARMCEEVIAAAEGEKA